MENKILSLKGKLVKRLSKLEKALSEDRTAVKDLEQEINRFMARIEEVKAILAELDDYEFAEEEEEGIEEDGTFTFTAR
jgi:hypothetical protein